MISPSTSQSVQISVPFKAVLHFTSVFLEFNSDLLMERVVFLLNAAFAMAILDLILHVHHEKNNQTRVLYETNSGRYRGQIFTLSFENLSVEGREYWHFQ